MGESKAEQLVGLAEAVAIVAIFPSFMLVVWAIWQRPPWRAIRDTIYFLLVRAWAGLRPIRVLCIVPTQHGWSDLRHRRGLLPGLSRSGEV